MRLFVAVEVPGELRHKIAALQRPAEGLRWVTPEQMHLTLRFVGHVEETIGARIKAGLQEIRANKFRLELSGAGAFPRPNSARVLWLGISDPQPLIDLKKEVDRAVDLPDPDGDRAYKPHLTLARIKDPRRVKARDLLAPFEQFPPAGFDVDHFVLFSSKLSPKGAIYTAEATHPLL